VNRTWITVLISTLGGGGLVWAIAAWRKVPAESAKITVLAAQGLRVVQDGVIEQLSERLKAVEDDNESLRERITKLESERRELHRELEDERLAKRELEHQNRELHERVRRLEAELAELRSRSP
jgi:septal ring factor EnvC (AmiA/AmiB activator)